MAGNRRNRPPSARPTPRSWPGSGRTPQRGGNRRRRRGGWVAFWGDRERRRALLLSVLLHAGVLLAFVFTYVAPEREPPEELIVLELTPSEPVAPQLEAAVDEPAPAAEAQVAGDAVADMREAPSRPAEPTPEVAEAEPELLTAEPITEAPLPPAQRPPAPQVPSQAAAPTPMLPAQAPASTLPEIDVVEVAPQPLENSLALPTPNPEVSVTPARELAVTPQVELSETQKLPTPEVVADIATQEIELPQVQVDVAPEDALPLPEAQAEVASSPLPQPQVAATVTGAQALPQPEVAAEVASREVPQPQAGAVVSEAQNIPQPAATAATAPAQEVPEPQVGAVVGEAQPLAVTPGFELDAAAPLVTPEVSATVNVPTQTAALAAPAGDGSGSVQPSDPATPDAQGEAAAGVTAAAEVAELQSFEVTVERPLAVLLDNADAAYPQQGLVEASSVFEMPVEGGLTRLMSVYTRADAAQLGPIRSARDYFLEASLAMNGTLVHVGGAPSTVSRIASQDLATVDALQESALFAQAVDRPAPHSTFAAGTTLRDAVGSLERQVSGTLYTPPADAPDVSALSVDYSADYASGFRYLSELDQYRWVRRDSQGQPVEATDAGGSAVTVDAVVVARVVAFPYPDDPEGRLYLPYSGGEATLYLRGKAIPGSWSPTGGFSFEAEGGAQVDLTPYKHWILFAPETAQVSAG